MRGLPFLRPVYPGRVAVFVGAVKVARVVDVPVAVVHAVRVPVFDVVEVVEPLVVRSAVLPDPFVVYMERACKPRSVGMAGHIHEAYARIVCFEGGHWFKIICRNLFGRIPG